jgi:hypothetical protein
MRLIDAGGVHFPLSRISHIEETWNADKRETTFVVHFADSSVTHKINEATFDNAVCGAMDIVQIIEPRKTYYAAMKHRDGSIRHETLNFLALCADGNIRGVWLLTDGIFEIVDHFANFEYISEHSTPEEHANAGEAEC